MATFVCRVQFLDDTDPFNSTKYPEPTKSPVYTFREFTGSSKPPKPVEVWSNCTAEILRQ
uniref:FHOD1 N-terminal GTPase-binding domain-containing protein n=1 Tax=Erpetoichthys calabaricus TaxID=27687 RepID=A0A8C4XBJ0_ERPCA